MINARTLPPTVLRSLHLNSGTQIAQLNPCFTPKATQNRSFLGRGVWYYVCKCAKTHSCKAYMPVNNVYHVV